MLDEGFMTALGLWWGDVVTSTKSKAWLRDPDRQPPSPRLRAADLSLVIWGINFFGKSIPKLKNFLPSTVFAMLLQSSPTSFLLPAPSLPSNPRSGSSAPFCPLVAKQGQVVGWKSTPSAKRRKVEVMANSAPAAAGTPLPGTGDPKSLRLLFVEMGTGYDQHG